MNGRRCGNREESREQASDSTYVWIMSRLTRIGTAEPISRDQILRREWALGNSIHLADHEQFWQLYTVDPYSAKRDDYRYIHT